MNLNFLIKGRFFRKLRKASSVSSRQLANFLNINRQTLEKKERADIIIDPDWIKAIPTMKEMSMEYFELIIADLQPKEIHQNKRFY